MKIRKGREVVIAGSLILALVGLSATLVAAQSTPGGFPSVVKALRAAPGCLGVETGQTMSGRQVIFRGRRQEGAGRLVSLGRASESDEIGVPQSAVRPRAASRSGRGQWRDPGHRLGQFASAPAPGATAPAISSIGIELTARCRAASAVGGRFAPDALKVRGLREIDIGRRRANRR